MSFRVAKISAVFLFLSTVLLPVTGRADNGLKGSAALSYLQYDVTQGGNDLYSGSSLVQQYSVSYFANNLRFRNQQNYYNLNVGYDLINFATQIDQPGMETAIKQHSGRLKYSGDIAFKAAQYPIRFRVYSNDNPSIHLPNRVNNAADLLADPLVYNIEESGISTSSGFYLAFEPKTSGNATLRALPSLYLDYNETVRKISKALSGIDEKTRKLSVAGLNQQNNWVNYRFLNYENYLHPEDNYVRQQFQIGHVDQKGRRKWAALTNWIDVSVDGQLSTESGVDRLDEYDLNFMAIATRRSWVAKTFLNYNRSMETYVNDRELTETARIPLYINGVYGPQTDWHMRLSAERGAQTLYKPDISKKTSYVNTASLGATTFKRNLFTLSPSLVSTISKGFGGAEALDLLAAVETNSTAIFSKKVMLGGRLASKYYDDGSGSPESKSLDNLLDLRADYSPDRKLFYLLKETLTFGDAASANYLQGQSGTEKYWGSFSLAKIFWVPNAVFSTWLESSYELQNNESGINSKRLKVEHDLTFNKNTFSLRFLNRYSQSNNDSSRRQNLLTTGGSPGNTSISSGSTLENTINDTAIYSGSNVSDSSVFTSMGDFKYRPDRYTDATLHYNYVISENNGSKSSGFAIREKYSYNFFTRTGEVRNIATVSQEAVFAHNNSGAGSSDGLTKSYSSYLSLTGRYSPFAKLSLYGSVRYGKDDPANPGAAVIYYSAGLNANFKLLSTSLDYSYARRDSDNRIEKKLAASVRRTF